MNDAVATILISACLLLAGWALVLVVLGRSLDNPLFYGLATLEAGLVTLLIGGLVALGSTDRVVDGVSYVGYLLTALLIPPIAVVWSVAEKSRWGTSVLVAAPLVVAVMIVRLQAIWTAGG